MDIDFLQRRAYLILTRLEAFRVYGGGATIHDTNLHLATVRGYTKMLDKPGRYSREEVARDLQEAIQGAEQFLASR